MIRLISLLTLVPALALPLRVAAHEPDFTQSFDRAGCNFTSVGSNPYFPLWPGYSLTLEGEEDDGGELVELEVIVTVLADTELVDGVLTRVLEERESEDGELVEVSRNFMAVCRETGDVWYFGEDVDDYEDGVIVGHGGAWRTGVDGAQPGVIMPGSPMVGARYYQELAPGVAEDRGEIEALDQEVTVPAGTFQRVLSTLDTSSLSPGSPGDVKLYAYGVGLIVDEVLELTEITPPPCQPDDTTLCLNNGRFRVRASWEDFQGNQGSGHAILPSADSGEFWFFNAGNTELVVKVLDGCGAPTNGAYWVFAAGLTSVEVVLTVTDTEHDQTKTYTNASGHAFEPILDTAAFETCP